MLTQTKHLNGAKKDGVSVVICTYNGAMRLQGSLDALSNCVFDRGGEVVLVDNNSTDNSAVFAASYWESKKDTPVPLRIINEFKQGLTWARRAGAQAAHYDTIIYCDDDNLLDPDYVSVATELMRDRETGAASGVSRPVSSVAFPAWFYTFADNYAVGCQAPWSEPESEIDMTPFDHRCPWGAGLVVRRQDLLKVFGCPNFPLLLDRNGTTQSAGGDYEICHLIALQGKRLLFSPRLRLDHAIPVDRLNLDYLSRLRAGFVEQTSVLQAYATLRGLLKRNRAHLVAGGLMQLFKNALRGRSIRRELFAISVGIDHCLQLIEVERKVFENYKFVR